ncbi:MAG: hypothetical protein LAT64_00165 [Phycisphaerales bacterium]|nr:hypothetical protein [Planctomycetota bacterium]MCH8507176.1 hypothetical protein [Phycisphaerales bacterium]
MSRTSTVLAIHPIRRLFAGLALGLVLAAGTPSDAYAQTYNADGWTVLQPSEDTRFVFVSSSEGNDQNSGRSPAQPVRTIARAKELIRDGYPDWMLLKRGDVWNEGLGSWRASGRSNTERSVIASYGDSDDRPKLILTDISGIIAPYQQDTSHVAIVGIHFESNRTDSSPRGIRWLSTGKDLLVEDCYIGGFKDNVTIEGQGDGFSDVIFRRNIVVDAWSISSHSQGLFINRTENILIEENVIDHNGWNPNIAGANPTGFNQNVYVQTSTENTTFVGNITARASGAGAQLRNGGIARHNLFYANPMPLRFGYNSSSNGNSGNASGEVKFNTVVGGPLSNPNAGSSFGIWLERLDGVEVMHNVITTNQSGESNIWGFSLHGFARNGIITNNVVYGWNDASGAGGQFLRSAANAESTLLIKDNIWFLTAPSYQLFRIDHPSNFHFVNNRFANLPATQDAFRIQGNSRINFNQWSGLAMVNGDQLQATSFVDPGRNLKDYAQHLGFTDEVAFLEAARQLSRRNWRPELTAEAASAWIRAGYQVQPN